MPYIKQEDRCKFISTDLDYIMENVETPGELNYLLTKILLTYVKEHGKCYATYNELIGVLECCKQEFYRKAISPYENEKCKENGEVYK